MSSMTLGLLRVAYAGPHAAKRIARDARVPVKTAENWWQAVSEMRADMFVTLLKENAELRAELVCLLGKLDGAADTHGRGAMVPSPGPVVGADCGPAGPSAAEAHAVWVARSGADRRGGR